MTLGARIHRKDVDSTHRDARGLGVSPHTLRILDGLGEDDISFRPLSHSNPLNCVRVLSR